MKRSITTSYISQSLSLESSILKEFESRLSTTTGELTEEVLLEEGAYEVVNPDYANESVPYELLIFQLMPLIVALMRLSTQL